VKLWVRAVAGLVAALVTFAILFFGRHFFAGHAALVSIAAGALVYSALGTSARLKRIYGRKGPRSIRRQDE